MQSPLLTSPGELSALARGPHLIVVGNEKGGAGKSTIAMHLIVALLKQGRRVGAIDLDLRQRTLTRYIENRLHTSALKGMSLPMPQVSEIPSATVHAQDFEGAFGASLARLAETCHFVVVDAPGSDTPLARAAHAAADTLLTPMNDSFVDFDLLGDIHPESFEVLRPSFYSELIWESRKRKAQMARRPIDWVVMRNRLSAGKIEARNKVRVGDALHALSGRIGFRVAPGFAERVVYRELFPQGLTLLDVLSGAPADTKLAHVAARQEVRDLLIVLKLPGLEGEPLRF